MRLLRAAARYPCSKGEIPDLAKGVVESWGISLSTLSDNYFATIHQWLPILDKETFCGRIRSRAEPEFDDSFAALVLAVHLLTQLPCKCGQHTTDTLLYRATRRLFMLTYTETEEPQRLDILQAGLLISVYECGHGLAQRAYATLGCCLTLSRMMSLDCESSLDGEQSDTHPISRACWAIILLDRYVDQVLLAGCS